MATDPGVTIAIISLAIAALASQWSWKQDEEKPVLLILYTMFLLTATQGTLLATLEATQAEPSAKLFLLLIPTAAWGLGVWLIVRVIRRLTIQYEAE